MGNFCCSGQNESNKAASKKHEATLIKIQSAVRSHLAKKRLKEIRNSNLKSLFGRYSFTPTYACRRADC
jgi:hypothetical protein